MSSFLRVTLRGGHKRHITRMTESEWKTATWRNDYEVVADAYDENGIRYMLGILARVQTGADGCHRPLYALGDTHDYIVVEERDNGRDKLRLFVRSWQRGQHGRSSYLYGIIHTYRALTKNNRHARKAKKRAAAKEAKRAHNDRERHGYGPSECYGRERYC